MNTTRVLLTLALMLLPIEARAQEPHPAAPRRALMHWGKWATLGTAVVLTAFAEREHRASQREWDQLLQICRANNNDCAIGADGHYVTYQAELHYEASIYYAHRARHRLIGGQLGLLASAVMFIADLRGGTESPKNIPFHAVEVTPGSAGDGVNLGLRFAF